MLTLFTADTANGQRASIALEEAGLEYRRRALDLAAGEHQADEILELNPVGRIPFLELARDEMPRVLYGTLPIAIFAAESCGRFLPDTGPGRYEVLQWGAFAVTDLGHVFANQFLFEELLQTADNTVKGFVHEQIRRMLGIVEQRLRVLPFIAGNEYSIADMLAYPTAANSAQRLSDGLVDYPALRAWAERLSVRPAIRRGMELP